MRIGNVAGSGAELEFAAARLRLICAWLALSACVMAQSPEDFPHLHLTRTADVPQALAHFGYSAAAGRLGTSLDTHDDVVACAIDKAIGSDHGVGTGYVYLDAALTPPSNIDKRELLPLAEAANQQLGRLNVQIGNPRGSGYDNLIMVSAWGTTAHYCGDTASVPMAGSVEIYDFNDAGFVGLPSLSLVAPLNAGTGDCADLVPAEVVHFGTGLALADVTRDGVDDLIVGAPETIVGDEDGLGRIYIFAGNQDFLVDPYSAWIGLNAPESSNAQLNSGVGFGNSVATARLAQDGDSGLKEVVVGRCDRFDHANGGEPEGGTAVVFRGSYLHDLFGGETLNAVTDPVQTDELDAEVPEYQVLGNPFGMIQPFGSGRSPLYADWFGWFVFSVGDVGSPNGGDFDGIDDIVVHAEGTDYIGTGSAESPQVTIAGGDFVYFGTGIIGNTNLVYPDHVLLMTPSNAGLPEFGARFGRATTRVEWLNSETDEVEPALLISDIDGTVGTSAHAGKVYLVRLPIPAQPTDPLEPADIENAWGSTPLTEPGGAGALHLFGSWILALDYWGNQSQQPGQQIVITSRGSPVVVQSQTKAEAGKFYSFTPNQP